MGLDANLYSTAKKWSKDLPSVDVDLSGLELVDVMYWRKHGQLQNWFHAQYKKLNGKSESFNCAKIRVDIEMIQQLIIDINSGNMPSGDGFFFGGESSEKLESDLVWAKNFLSEADWENLDYWYDSWW